MKVKAEDENGWVFSVQVEDMDYEVTVKRGDYERLTGGKIEPEELVENSFKFLLAIDDVEIDENTGVDSEKEWWQ